MAGWLMARLGGCPGLCTAGGLLSALASLLFLQEVLLKRAADLVEALYGMPHNNQVRDKSRCQPLPRDLPRGTGRLTAPAPLA